MLSLLSIFPPLCQWGFCMKTKNRKLISLRHYINITTTLCWAIPVLLVIVASGILLRYNAVRTARHEWAMNGSSALSAVSLKMDATIEASKAVSYDGVIRDAYIARQAGGADSDLYNASNSYLTQKFSRDESVKAVLIRFTGDDTLQSPYLLNRQNLNLRWLTQYRESTEPALLRFIEEKDTGIYFCSADGELFMIRKLFDSNFRPYAVLTIICDCPHIFSSLLSFSYPDEVLLTIDGEGFALAADGTVRSLDAEEQLPPSDSDFTADVDGHSIEYISRLKDPKVRLVRNYPELGIAGAVVMLLAVLLLPILYHVNKKSITTPVNTLLDATHRVSNGERGYQIPYTADSEEFQRLYEHFNVMSSELKSQFERIYLEQQSLQQIRIRALQSQINPHFLNNTLEVINWEARMAGNDKIGDMIEALSTMLNAALDRDERPMIPLREELTYVDAYLYIIRERLGEGFTAESHVDPALSSLVIPRLILQPIVENAVEHDITSRHGGKLTISVSRSDDHAILAVEHDGVMSPEDHENIGNMLKSAPSGKLPTLSGHIGLSNVYTRLKLIYGEDASLSVEQVSPETIRAAIALPLPEGSGKDEVCP